MNARASADDQALHIILLRRQRRRFKGCNTKVTEWIAAWSRCGICRVGGDVE